MKIGLMTDSLGGMSRDELLNAADTLGLQAVEFSTGNWASAPHLDLEQMLADEGAREAFLGQVAERGLEISALNCSGNQLAPGDAGRRHDEVVRKTIRLASVLRIERVVLMSGLPAAPGDRYPNWVTVAWPPEAVEVLDHQWSDVAIPYWRDLAAFAGDLGIRQLCIEPHGHQLVFNTETLLRLREAVGPTVGVNFDPSHMMWMGGDPLTAIRRLEGAIFHVHAKDTRLDAENRGPNTLLETKPMDRVRERSWSYVTLGYGHPEAFWRDFVTLLKQVGYDGVLSIEHEDQSMPPLEGVRKSVELLQRVVVRS